MASNHSNQTFEVQIDGQTFPIDNPEPTGQELLALVNKTPQNFLLTLVIPNAPYRLVEPDETFDLTAPGIEQFVLVSKAHHFAFRIDEHPLDTTERFLTGSELLAMAGKSTDDCLLTLSVVDQVDPQIDPEEKFDLAQPGREQFFVVAKKPLFIFIDGAEHTPHKAEMTGAELRHLPVPPLPDERSLWFDVPGQDDVEVQLSQKIKFTDGMAFYSKEKKKFFITVVVSGSPTDVYPDVHAPLRNVVVEALKATGNDMGRPADEWELKDKDGLKLDVSRRVEEFGFASGVKLYLAPIIGAGGSNES